MESAKEKAIREAYGEHWDKVKNTVNTETGWCMMYNSDNQKVSENFIDLGFTQTYVSENIDSGYNHDTNTHEWRPKSLQGIYTNNGWTRIESEADLPTEKCLYKVILKTGEYDTYPFMKDDGEYWINTFSHYEKIEFKPPIY